MPDGESVTTEELMCHIRVKAHDGSVYYADAFRGCQSLKRYWKHPPVNYSKSLVDKRTKTLLTVAKVSVILSISCITTGVLQSIAFPCSLRKSSTVTITDKRICLNASLNSC